MENLAPSAFSHEPAQYSVAPSSSSQALSTADGSAPPTESAPTGDNNYVPRPKRIACVVCRRRKLRCDGQRPRCGTCSRLGHDCAYDEVRKKSGPKRGYVKQLEARLGMKLHVTVAVDLKGPREHVANVIAAILAQVETLLKGQESDTAQQTTPLQPQDNAFTASFDNEPILALPEISGLGTDMGNAMPSPVNEMGASQPNQTLFQGTTPFPSDPQWDLISLGLEEPLPAPEVVQEL